MEQIFMVAMPWFESRRQANGLRHSHVRCVYVIDSGVR